MIPYAALLVALVVALTFAVVFQRPLAAWLIGSALGIVVIWYEVVFQYNVGSLAPIALFLGAGASAISAGAGAAIGWCLRRCKRRAPS